MALSSGTRWSQWVSQAREDEQRKISQDLNDYMLEALDQIDRQLSGLHAGSGGADDESLTHMQSQLHTVLDMARSMYSDLHPYASSRSGLLATMQSWLGMLERRGIFHVTLTTEGDLEQI